MVLPYFLPVLPSLPLLCSHARAHSKCCSTCQSIHCQHFSFSKNSIHFPINQFCFVCFTLAWHAFCCSLSPSLLLAILIRPVVWLSQPWCYAHCSNLEFVRFHSFTRFIVSTSRVLTVLYGQNLVSHTFHRTNRVKFCVCVSVCSARKSHANVRWLSMKMTRAICLLLEFLENSYTTRTDGILWN